MNINSDAVVQVPGTGGIRRTYFDGDIPFMVTRAAEIVWANLSKFREDAFPGIIAQNKTPLTVKDELAVWFASELPLDKFYSLVMIAEITQESSTAKVRQTTLEAIRHTLSYHSANLSNLVITLTPL